MVSRGYSLWWCVGFSLWWLLLLQSTGSAVVAHGLGCSAVCGIFLDQGLNPCPLHWQADSLSIVPPRKSMQVLCYQLAHKWCLPGRTFIFNLFWFNASYFPLIRKIPLEKEMAAHSSIFFFNSWKYFTSGWKWTASTLFTARHTVFTNTVLVIWGNVHTSVSPSWFSFRRILFTKKKCQQYRKNYFPNKFSKT